ncbi:hypothetical protein LTR36_004055 [Oleoguttula mirabilis]|uniref:Macro domain-containing protein n=1 Tax=Oleoguttula mirabilis TaxID=1507867 RepID=A0AAV9JHB7_9PEZI|nr:hypothetical protein LTR36_004055 [Oleoguttula mirabilis]
MATKLLSDLPTLTLLYKLNKLSPSAFPLAPGATPKYNDKISLIRTDITKLKADAIVNAANESLLGGGGVDGAIHSAAGPHLKRECRTLDGCDTGDAKITDAYELPCKKVIHAVGPVYRPTKRQGMHTTLLSGCYTRSLDLAVESGCRSIAFSALSTGVYGYPSEEAAETAIAAVAGWLEEDEARAARLERVVFCSFLQKDERAYEKFIPMFFPPASEQSATTEEGGETATKAEEDETMGNSEDGETARKEEEDETMGTAEEHDTGGKAEEDETMGTAEEGETEPPQLPDVPTQAPKEEGEPDAKKQKLDVHDATAVEHEEPAKEHEATK